MKIVKSLAVLAVPLIFLIAADDKELTCPISKKAAKADIFLEVNGKKVNFCCNNCAKEYAKKINLDVASLSAAPTACPISGKAGNKAQQVVKKTAKLVSFCCGNCLSKTLKGNKLTATDKGPTKCPVSEKEAKNEEGTSLLVNGEKIYFCCKNCPKSYAKKLGISGKALAKEPGDCPISGRPAKADKSLILVKSELVSFCCGNCKKKYVAANFKNGQFVGKAMGEKK